MTELKIENRAIGLLCIAISNTKENISQDRPIIRADLGYFVANGLQTITIAEKTLIPGKVFDDALRTLQKKRYLKLDHELNIIEINKNDINRVKNIFLSSLNTESEISQKIKQLRLVLSSTNQTLTTLLAPS